MPADFAPQLDGFFLGPAGYVQNGFMPDRPTPFAASAPFDPFAAYRNRFGPQYLAALWSDAYASPPNPEDAIFKEFIGCGLCNGFTSTIAMTYDLWRFGKGPRMCQLGGNLGPMLVRALIAQMQVLTDDLLLSYKWFLLRPHVEAVNIIRRDVGPQGWTHLFNLVPDLKFSLPTLVQDIAAFRDKLSDSHSLLIRWWENLPIGYMRLHVWDPNFPDDDDLTITVSPQGAFTYNPHGKGPVYTTDDVPTLRDAQGDIVQMGLLKGIPVPCALFFPQAKRNYLSELAVIFG
jgi:hypothetical protein